MIDIKKKSECCGCNACGDICSNQAITFKTDFEGFWYPEINKDKCTNCGLCEKVCPIINVSLLKKNDYKDPKCYASIIKNLEIRFDSTSGGMFSAFANRIYKDRGFVGGAIFNEDFSVRHFISNNKEDLKLLRSSKYLQSNAENFYKSVRELVIKGETVLVCGTPCQMSALRAFLNYKNYNNLIIIDFICRGINSPKVFRKYIDYQEEKHKSKLIYFKAKNKELGWRNLTSKLIFANNEVEYDTKDTSYFTIGYLHTGVYCRPSCYDCKFKGFPRISDITIADYWGAEKYVNKELDNDLGTSLVLINSVKGMDQFNKIRDSIEYTEIPFESIFNGNKALTKSLNPPIVDRKTFYNDLNSLKFIDVANKYIKQNTTKLSIKKKCRNIAKFVFQIVSVSGFSLHTYYKNIKYNFFKPQIKSSINKGYYLLINKYCILDVNKNSTILLNGIFRIGHKTVHSSKLETRILISKNASLIMNGNFTIGYGSDVEIFENAKLEVGNNCATNINTTIICAKEIVIGNDVAIGRNVVIRDNNGNHYISLNGYKTSKSVYIGEHSWLCEGCTIMGGTKLGIGVIVSAMSLVNGHFKSFSLISGNPAKVIENNIYWKY